MNTSQISIVAGVNISDAKYFGTTISQFSVVDSL